MKNHLWKIEWRDAMSVGIDEIDEDHKIFAGLINDLNEAIVERMDLEELKRLLDLIVDDAVQHFDHEERLFAQWHYPDAPVHALRHAEAIKDVLAIKARVENSDLQTEWIEGGMEIKDSLINHLITEDMKYAKYYRDNLKGREATF